MNDKKTVNKTILLAISAMLFFCLILCGAFYVLINLTLKEKSQTPQSVTMAPTASPLPAPTNYIIAPAQTQQLNLKFKNINFTITGQQVNPEVFNYWAAVPETKNVTAVESLYDYFGNGKGDLFYLPSKDTYYGLEPSGNNSWSLTDEAFLTKNIGTTTKTVEQTAGLPLTIKTTCSKGLRKVGNDFLTSLECREVYTQSNNGKETILQETYVTKCLFNYSGGKYLMFSQDTASAGSDKDACAILDNLGFQSVTSSK